MRNTRLTDQDLERIAEEGTAYPGIRLTFAAKWARHLPALAAELVDRRRAMREDSDADWDDEYIAAEFTTIYEEDGGMSDPSDFELARIGDEAGLPMTAPPRVIERNLKALRAAHAAGMEAAARLLVERLDRREPGLIHTGVILAWVDEIRRVARGGERDES